MTRILVVGAGTAFPLDALRALAALKDHGIVIVDGDSRPDAVKMPSPEEWGALLASTVAKQRIAPSKFHIPQYDNHVHPHRGKRRRQWQ